MNDPRRYTLMSDLGYPDALSAKIAGEFFWDANDELITKHGVERLETGGDKT